MANRILLGEHDNFGYGLFISRPTKDVTTNLAKTDLIFDSRENASSLVHAITLITASSGSAYGSGSWTALPYVPMVMWTQLSASSNADVLGMGHHYSSSFVFGQGLTVKAGTGHILYNITSSACRIRTPDGTNFPSTKYFGVVVFRFPLPS